MSPEDVVRDPRSQALRLQCLARCTLGALGVAGVAPDEITILEHSITQACAELGAVQQALSELDETSVLISALEGIRRRLELASESRDLLAELAASVGSEAHK